MKRYLKHIFLALTATLMAVSCLEELEIETPTFGDEVVTLVPRVQSFANRYVTKAEYADNETIISKYTVLVFNNAGNLVHKQSVTGDDPFKLNKSMLNSSANGDLTEATVVMLANMDYEDVNNAGATVTKLSDFETCTYKPAQAVITSISDGFTGFPMIGGIKMVNLSSTKDQQPPLAVELKILYAKIHFEIAVAEGGENDNVATNGMQFVLSGCTVYNSATATSIAIPAVKDKPAVDFLGDPVSEEPAEVDGATSSSNYSGSTATSLGKTGTAKLNGDKINFTFYVLESRYNHGSDLRGIYPDDSWLASTPQEDVKGYNADTDDAKRNGVKYYYDDRIQQYKPKLAKVSSGNPAGKATYVRLNGTYTDYRGVAWKVEYDLYLGKDNAQNFHVDRNSEYTNLVTIKGLRNRQDDAYGENDVWIDHRVNVSYNGNGVDDHVTITRETLLDAHIEVRPLRVKWDNNEFDGVRIYLPTKTDGSLVHWIGIERFTGNNNADKNVYCYADGKSTGKRRYFTTDLITELQTKQGEYGVREDENTKQKYIYLLMNECAWIYFDENLGNTDRDADIKLEFYPKEGRPQSMVYKVKQRCLQTVGGYAIESYEEYLHSYDSADKYNLSTSPVDYTQQGLEWGFPEHRLSQNILVSDTEITRDLTKDERFKRYVYDYFHESDGATYKLYTKTSGSWATTSFGTGHSFTERASANRDIAVKDMGTLPENAYQYCLSKNKFEVVGLEEVTMTLNWYLPDPYEMQAILDASQKDNNTADIDADAFYWSSQPAFNRESYLGSTFINENISNAIAVSAQQLADDFSRRSQNRIRCVYNRNAKPLTPQEMEDRVPDGIGGNYSIYMKAWNGTDEAHFHYMLDYVDTKTHKGTVAYKYKDEDYPYPTVDNNEGRFGFFANAVDENDISISGFTELPTDRNKWGPYSNYYYPDGSILPSQATFYPILTTFPGLSDEVLKYDNGLGSKGGSRETGKKRSDIQIDSTIIRSTLTQLVNENNFKNLNEHLLIKFPQSGSNTQNPFPQFVYSAYDEGSKADTTVRKWRVPTYTKSSYTPKPDIDYVRGLTVTGTGTVNGFLGVGDTSKAEEDARKQALENAEIQASRQFPNRTYEPVKGYQLTVKGSWNWSGTKYTATATFKGDIECATSPDPVPYYADARNGGWVVEDGYPHIKYLNEVQVDELRMFCGNAFTISLSEAAKNAGYEITKIKVHYSGNNYVGESGGVSIFGQTYGADKVYARFVESTIDLSKYKLENQPVIGSAEVLQLPGMDYSADGVSGWHQWSGEGSNSITLILADYNVNNNAGVSYSYMYDTSPLKSEKYIIVDQIEVKCTKRKNATFDFKQIYTEGGNIETSYCTVKHITFTVEGGTEDKPSGATAEGLKLYAGSKVTFKALDGYVINSISGDESLKFTGTNQVVERTIPSDKTITAPIVVLYSKAATETN